MRRVLEVAAIFTAFVATWLVLSVVLGVALHVQENTATERVVWFLAPAAGALLGVYVVCRVTSDAKGPFVSFWVICAIIFSLLFMFARTGGPTEDYPDPREHILDLLLQAVAVLGGAPIGFVLSRRRRSHVDTTTETSAMPLVIGADEQPVGRRMADQDNTPENKRPALAATLAFVLGPFGLLYLGWRFTVLSFVMLLVFTLPLTLLDLYIPPFAHLLILAVFGWKAHTIATVQNELIEAGDPAVHDLRTFSLAWMAVADLLTGVGMAFAASLGLSFSYDLFSRGSVLRALAMLALGTPILVYLASLLFGLVSMGLSALVAAGKPGGSSMALFRRRRRPAADSPATTLAANICGAARGVARSVVQHSDAELHPDAEWKLYMQYVFLMLHSADRAAFSRLPQAKRAAFIDELMRSTVQMMVLAYQRGEVLLPGGPGTPGGLREHPSVDDLLLRLEFHHLEYAACDRLLSERNSPDEQSGTVLDSFFRNLPEPWRTQLTTDILAVIEHKTAIKSLLEGVASVLDEQLQRVAALD